MSSEKINGEQPSMVEWGGVGPAERLTGRLDWLTTDRPVIRGAGIGCALAGFGLLVAAELLPWMSVTTSPLQQDFPTSTGGRVETGAAQLTVATDILNLGWLIVLAVVATALVVGPPVRHIIVAAGLGLVAGQLAMLAGITRGIEHTTNSSVFRGAIITNEVPVQLEIGLYCAYGAIALFALALLLAGGLPRRLRDAEVPIEEADPGLRGPADLTVTPLPAGDPGDYPGTDRSPWSRHDPDIDVSGRHPDR
jgi:hypothetical protein